MIIFLVIPELLLISGRRWRPFLCATKPLSEAAAQCMITTKRIVRFLGRTGDLMTGR